MATGRMVVATRHAGIPELVTDDQTGFLVSEGQPAALADMMVYAIQHQEDWKPMVVQARAKVEQEHDVVKQCVKLEKLMDELICGEIRVWSRIVRCRRTNAVSSMSMIS